MLGGSLLTVERVVRGRTKAIDSAGVRELLVLEYMVPLGCCVHLTPLFAALRRCRPEMKITVATRGLGAQVLRHSLDVDRVLVTPDPLTDLADAVKYLRGSLSSLGVRPDCVMTGASDQRTRIALLGVLGANGWRGGYTVKPSLYHRPLVYDRSLSLIANNLRLAGLLGCEGEATEPRIFFSREDAEAARALLGEVNADGRPVVVMVTQNSGGQRTGWHMSRFVQVIRHVVEALGCAIVYVGTAGDEAAIEAIRQAAGGLGSSVAGRTSVTELAALLAISDAMVTLDTGTMHVGRAMGTPMVVLGPSWQRPVEWLPLTVANARILRGPDRESIPETYQLDEISAEAVVNALDDILHAYPPSAEAREHRLGHGLSSVDHLGAM